MSALIPSLAKLCNTYFGILGEGRFGRVLTARELDVFLSGLFELEGVKSKLI